MTYVVKYWQILIFSFLPNRALSGAKLLGVGICVQYFLRFFRFLQIERSTPAFILEPAWAKDIKILLIFMLSGHLVGSCWYLFGLQRLSHCLQEACKNSKISTILCSKVIVCGHHRVSDLSASQWKNNVNATACFNSSSVVISYGIYEDVVQLTLEDNLINKYLFALFWGFQQIITLADNLTPSYKYAWEVLFTMAIMGLGLCFFALLIGNIQSFLQTLRHRRLEMELRGRDVEQWMSHHRIPDHLRRKVQEAELYNWAATRGVNNEMFLENLPEDLQTEIRRHIFEFVKKVPIFDLMDEPILDAIYERLKHKTYIKGSSILSEGGIVKKMVFVMRGKLKSTEADGSRVFLSEGNACGEELLTWYLERASVSTDGKRVRLTGQRLLSNRTIRCLTNVEAFSLRLADLEDVTFLFTGFLHNPRVQATLRYKSPHWRSLAAKQIQVAWRNRKRTV